MAEKKETTSRPRPKGEQKGLVQDVVVPIVASGVGGYVAGKVAQGKNPKK